MMILLVLSLFAHNQHWYMIGKWGAIVILNLAIVLFSCLMVILDTDSNEAILHLVNKLTSFRDPKRLE